MRITDDVMNDLMTVYLSGEASADTRALVEAHARQNPVFAAQLEAARTVSIDAITTSPPPHDHELRALAETRQFILLRTVFCASGVLFGLLPLTFTFGDNGQEFLILGRHPGLVWSFWSLAAASWIAFYVMNRRIRQVGL